jgi:hypothetical protein
MYFFTTIRERKFTPAVTGTPSNIIPQLLMFDPVQGQESRLPTRPEARADNIRPSLLCLFCHFKLLLLFPSLFALRIFSLYACLYYFFRLLLLPLFLSPLCSLDCFRFVFSPVSSSVWDAFERFLNSKCPIFPGLALRGWGFEVWS